MINPQHARSELDDEDPTAEYPVLNLHEFTQVDPSGHPYRVRVVIESDLPAPGGTRLRSGDPYNTADVWPPK